MQKQRQCQPQLPTGFYVDCPHCKDELRIHREFLGAHAQCKFCDGQFPFVLANPDLNVSAVFTQCPHCAQELRAASIFLGRQVACKHCDLPFQLSTLGLTSQARQTHVDIEVIDGNSRSVTAQNPAEDTRRSVNENDTCSLGAPPIRDVVAEDWYDDPTEGWFCKILGQTMGPMNLPALKDLARNGQLSSDDRVRCGEGGDWQSPMMVTSLLADLHIDEHVVGGEVSGDIVPPSSDIVLQVQGHHAGERASLARDAIEAETMTTCDEATNTIVAEACTVAATEDAKSRTPDIGSNNPSRENQSHRPVKTPPLVAVMENATGSCSSSTSLINREDAGAGRTNSGKGHPQKATTPPPQKGPTPWKTPPPPLPLLHNRLTFVVGLASACLIVCVIWLFDLSSSNTMKHFRALQSISEEFIALRDKRVSSAQWVRLHRSATIKLKPIVQDLSSTDDPAGRALLRAARDHLPAMLLDARHGLSKSEEEFYRDLTQAEAYLNGSPPNAE